MSLKLLFLLQSVWSTVLVLPHVIGPCRQKMPPRPCCDIPQNMLFKTKDEQTDEYKPSSWGVQGGGGGHYRVQTDYSFTDSNHHFKQKRYSAHMNYTTLVQRYYRGCQRGRAEVEPPLSPPPPHRHPPDTLKALKFHLVEPLHHKMSNTTFITSKRDTSLLTHAGKTALSIMSNVSRSDHIPQITNHLIQKTGSGTNTHIYKARFL